MSVSLDRTHVRVLRTDEEYDAAHAELLKLLDAGVDEGHSAYDRLELLTVLISAYDREHVRVRDVPVSPQEAVLFTLEQRGMARADLEGIMGGKARVSEFFSGKRPLSMQQLQNLRAFLGIPAELLLPPAPEGVVPIRSARKGSTAPTARQAAKAGGRSAGKKGGARRGASTRGRG